MLLVAKLRVHIEDFAENKSLRFVGYSILNMVNRRVHLPQVIFANDITRMAREPHLEPYMVCNGIFIDVGANVGMWTIYMAKKGVRVYAFEPSPQPFRVLRNLNKKYPNIVPLPYALGEENYLAKLKLHRASGHNGLVKQAHDFGGHEISIQVRTLDSFDIQNVGLIKIDTEGYEVPVLLGACDTIRKWKPRLIIEVHTPYEEQKAKILESLQELNYHWIIRYKPSMQPHIIADPK